MQSLIAIQNVESGEQALLQLLAEAHNLSGVDRANLVADGSRNENVAEHSWHVALCAVVLARRYAADVDLGRVLEMLALHDLPEVRTGDTPVMDETARAAAIGNERDAADRLFASNPDRDQFLALYDEFVAAETAEARFANAVDRLQPIVLHLAGQGVAWLQRDERRTRIDAYAGKIRALWPPLGDLAAALVETGVLNKYLRDA